MFVVLISILMKETRHHAYRQVAVWVEADETAANKWLDDNIRNFYPNAIKNASGHWMPDSKSGVGDLFAAMVEPISEAWRMKIIRELRMSGW